MTSIITPSAEEVEGVHPGADPSPTPQEARSPSDDAPMTPEERVAHMLATIANIPTTHEDLNYLYTNVLYARGSLSREVRREAVIAIKTYRDILDAVREHVSPSESRAADGASSASTLGNSGRNK